LFIEEIINLKEEIHQVENDWVYIESREVKPVLSAKNAAYSAFWDAYEGRDVIRIRSTHAIRNRNGQGFLQEGSTSETTDRIHAP